MPSTSKKQARFMAAVANNPKFAKKAGVSQNVGKDFFEADKAEGKYLKKAKGGAVEFGAGLSQFKGNNRPTRLPNTGMKYSPYRLNPGSQLNRSIKLNSRIPVPKFAEGGQMPQGDTKKAVKQLMEIRARYSGTPGVRTKLEMADGGKVRVSMNALKAINEALEHLSNRDVPSASRALRSSKEAMAHPDVADVANSLRSSAAIPGANKRLNSAIESAMNQDVPTLADGGQVCPHCGK